MERILTCDKCVPKPSCIDGFYEIDPHQSYESFQLHGSKNYQWAATGLKDPIAHSFKCFDCHKMAPADEKGYLGYMAVYMYGNVELPKEFRFTKYEDQENEFVVCDKCGKERHEQDRDGKGTVTNNVAKYIVDNNLLGVEGVGHE